MTEAELRAACEQAVDKVDFDALGPTVAYAKEVYSWLKAALPADAKAEAYWRGQQFVAEARHCGAIATLTIDPPA